MGMKVDPETEKRLLEMAGLLPKQEPPRSAAARTDEKDFQAAVVKRAKELGWESYHVTIAKMSKPGFVDQLFYRERIIHAELKAEDGGPDAEQLRWADIIRAAGGEYYLWRPSDWPQIEETLQRRNP